MKKTLLWTSLSISYSTFSFWPITESFMAHTAEESNPYFLKRGVHHRAIRINHDEVGKWFLYDPHTSTMLIAETDTVNYVINGPESLPSFSYLNPPHKLLKGIPSTLNYNHGIFKKLIKIMLTKKFSKQLLPLKYQKSVGMTEWWEKSNVKKVPIFFHKQFYSLSGVQINNIDQEVILSMDGKNIELTGALRHYFDKDRLELDYENNLVNDTDPLLNQINNSSHDPIDLELLKTSKILELWCLIPKDLKMIDLDNGANETIKKVEHQLLGLAKDENGDLFYWITNLRDDISVLLRHANENTN